MSQTDAANIARSLCCRTAENETWLPTMYSQTGIVTRRPVLGADVIRDLVDGTRQSGSVFLPSGKPDDCGPTTAQRMELYAKLAPPLALDAARSALSHSLVKAMDLTHLITVSCTGFVAPGVDLALISSLGLSPTIQRTHVGYMGCHGALNGLRVALAFTGAEADARVLLCAVELCCLHYHFGWNPSKMIANALFGDGAAALIGVPVDGADADAWRVTATGSCLIPGSADAMTWTVGNHGFEMTLSKQVPGLIAKHLRPWLQDWLLRQDVPLAAVGSWAVHPGGPRILTAVEEGLCLPRNALLPSRAVFAECGNMSSPTLLFMLNRLQQERPAGHA